MSDGRTFRWASTGARILAGTLVAAGFVVGVTTAAAAPWPRVAHEPVRIAVTPAPADTVLACTGGLLALGRDATSAGGLTVASPQGLVVAAGEGEAAPAQSLLETAGVSGGDGPVVFTAVPSDGERTDVAASGSAVVEADDLRGFAASACRPALMESWLIGGATTTGSADLVLLANPGKVPATAELTVYGPSGPQVPPGGVGVVIAPGTQRVIPLSGLVLGEGNPVVRVSTTGAPVRAALQTSLTRVLTPVGVDQVGAVLAPATEVVIPGVSVSIAPGAQGASNSATILRMLSPSADTEATVTVTAVGAIQPATAPQVLPMAAGLPVALDLGSLPVGQYVVQISAAAPVLAAAWASTGFDDGADFAWYAAAPPIVSPALFAVPAGPAAVLTLVNPAQAEITVGVSSVDGGFAQDVVVPSSGSVALRLPASGVYRLDPGASGQPVLAGLSFAGDGALAAISIWPADAVAPKIVVYP